MAPIRFFFCLSLLFVFFWSEGEVAVKSADVVLHNNANEEVAEQHRNLRFWNQCPPKNFASRETLDLDSYISALWYPQKSAPVIYAQSQSYCSVVKYTKNEDKCLSPLCPRNKPRINVRNRGLDGSITGSLNDARINAFVPKPNTKPAEIRVGFPQWFFFLKSNYWVVEAGTYDGILTGNLTNPDEIYEWALISGGAPKRKSNNGCIAGILGRFDTRGLWIFARDPFPPEGVVEAVDALARGMGLDTSTMIPVIHEGCTYDFLNN